MSYRPLTRDRYLDDDSLARFMGAVRDRRHVNQPRDLAFFALLANTGLRPSEALTLRVEDLHLAARPPWIRVGRRHRTNTARPVVELVVHPDVARCVVPWRSSLSGGGTKLFSFTKRQAARLFHYYLSRAGIAKPFKVYSLRHTFGMRMWRATKDLRLLQAILGHVRMKATRVYVHRPAADLLEPMEALGV